jgi:hypothetical protein
MFYGANAPVAALYAGDVVTVSVLEAIGICGREFRPRDSRVEPLSQPTDVLGWKCPTFMVVSFWI